MHSDDIVWRRVNCNAGMMTLDWIIATPGVSLEARNDTLGQQYRNPEQVILHDGCDIIIVGRSIIHAPNVAATAEEYRQAGWNAYLRRINQE